jgi:hypothetical protein
MSKAEKYRQYAADCLRFAQLARAPDERTVFAEMAAMWLRLAERACSASRDAKERTESP